MEQDDVGRLFMNFRFFLYLIQLNSCVTLFNNILDFLMIFGLIIKFSYFHLFNLQDSVVTVKVTAQQTHKMEHVKLNKVDNASQWSKKCTMKFQDKRRRNIHLDAYQPIKAVLFYRYLTFSALHTDL